MAPLLLNVAVALCWALAAYNLWSIVQHYRRSKREQATVLEFVCYRCGERWFLPHDGRGNPLPTAVATMQYIIAHRRAHVDDENKRQPEAAGALQ